MRVASPRHRYPRRLRYDDEKRNGHRACHLTVDHRSSRWTDLGGEQPGFWSQIESPTQVTRDCDNKCLTYDITDHEEVMKAVTYFELPLGGTAERVIGDASGTGLYRLTENESAFVRLARSTWEALLIVS